MGLSSTKRRGAAGVVIVCLTLSLVAYRTSLQLTLLDVPQDAYVPVATEHVERHHAADPSRAIPTAYREGIENGVLSNQDASFFRKLQADIDESDHTARCARYGWTYKQRPTKRRIFYGALISGEPWELLEISAAESYGIFSGMVFVEGNRTQNLTPRGFRQLHQGSMIADLFGLPANQVSIRPYVDENEDFTTEKFDHFALDREHRQRAEIIHGWKALGMQKEDIGLLADTDEIMTRDVFRALQVCDGIPQFDYASHKCHHSQVKVIAATRVFESSPECITEGREWHHPDLIIGHCLEEIGDESLHPRAPRDGTTLYRAAGFGSNGDDWDGETNSTTGYYPLWNAGDFRRTVGGHQIRHRAPGHDGLTAFHFHNFVAQFNKTRFKYLTFGHADKQAGTKPMKDLNGDAHMLVSCVQHVPYPPDHNARHLPGGFDTAQPFMPIYFQDADYRQRRHAHVKHMLESDDLYMAALRALSHAPVPKDVAPAQTVHAGVVPSNPVPPMEDAKADTTADATAIKALEPTAHREGMENGVLSTKDPSFFRKLQAEIDESDDTARCTRYGWTYNPSRTLKRRIFYGALISGEPWELLEISAAESFGIFSGMVVVEGNRTQNLTPRGFRQLHQGPLIANLFGLPANQVSVRPYVDENEDFTTEKFDHFSLDREHRQRAEIIHGWKALGMQKEDIGLLADVDEIMTRDVFRALQICDGIPQFDYASHKCHHSKVKVIAATRVFESSPECVTEGREWYHPDLIIGHCLEEIGDESLHPRAPRYGDTLYRANGFGGNGDDWVGEENITTGYYPLWNAGDFRRTVGGHQIRNREAGHDGYTAYHFHNFVAQFNKTRFKYMTFGHADKNAGTKPMKDLNGDAHMLVSCVQNVPYPSDHNARHLPEGFTKAKPFMPIYFYDAEYRQRRHAHVRHMLELDEAYMAALRDQSNETLTASQSNVTSTV